METEETFSTDDANAAAEAPPETRKIRSNHTHAKVRAMKCLICGQPVKSTWSKKRLPSRHIITYTEWKKSCSTTVCDLLNLSSSNSVYQHFLETESYCIVCNEMLRTLDFSQKSLVKLQQRIAEDIATLKSRIRENSQRNRPRGFRNESQRSALLRWPLERVKEEYGTTFSYSEVVHLLNDAIKKHEEGTYDDFFGDDEFTTLSVPVSPNAVYDGNASPSPTDETNYTCSYSNECGVFPTSKLLKEHLKKVHPKIQKSQAKVRIKCTYAGCTRYVSSEYNLKVHIKKMHLGEENPYECTEPGCNKTFQYHSTLTYHKNSVHGTSSFVCETCGKGFVVKKLLDTHIENYHSIAHQCDICGADCQTKEAETEHLEKHKLCANPFTCVICSKEYPNSANLKTHVKMEHPTGTMFKCQFCAKVFTKQQSLKGHLKYHIGTEDRKCKTCGKVCQSKAHLETHLTSHTKERKYCCEVCGRSYPYKKGLIRHQKVHTGKAPFKCKICGNAFAESSFLHRHEETHAGTQLYVCDLCGKRFQTNHGLWQHTRTHMDLPKKKRVKPKKKLDQNNVLKSIAGSDDASAKSNLLNTNVLPPAPSSFETAVDTWKSHFDCSGSGDKANTLATTVSFSQPLTFQYHQQESGNVLILPPEIVVPNDNSSGGEIVQISPHPSHYTVTTPSTSSYYTIS